jgi:hypothetical protein
MLQRHQLLLQLLQVAPHYQQPLSHLHQLTPTLLQSTPHTTGQHLYILSGRAAVTAAAIAVTAAVTAAANTAAARTSSSKRAPSAFCLQLLSYNQQAAQLDTSGFQSGTLDLIGATLQCG